MRRRFMLLVMCVLSLMVPWSALVEASQVCWRLQDGRGNPLLDFLRLSAGLDVATAPIIFDVHGGVEADPLYQQVGGGSATADVMNGGKIRMGLTITHDGPGWFGGNRTCSLTAILIANPADPQYLDGTWSTYCAGATPFSGSGLLSFFECPVLSALAQRQRGLQAEHKRGAPTIFPEEIDAVQQAIQAEQLHVFGEERAAGKGNFVFLSEP